MQTLIPENKIANDILIKFLLDHESDIANGINDFAELQYVFHIVFERLSKK